MRAQGTRESRIHVIIYLLFLESKVRYIDGCYQEVFKNKTNPLANVEKEKNEISQFQAANHLVYKKHN